MADSGVKYDETHPCEGSRELNGEQASYRTANMVSSPRTVLKQRIRGALVPMRVNHEAPDTQF